MLRDYVVPYMPRDYDVPYMARDYAVPYMPGDYDHRVNTVIESSLQEIIWIKKNCTN